MSSKPSEAGRGEIELITSALSITEVAFGAQERDAGITPEGEAAIEELWVPASPITLVDVSQTLAREARTVLRDARIKGVGGVRSADAIHLASAGLSGCTQISTYERATTRARWGDLSGVPVSEPRTDRPQLDI